MAAKRAGGAAASGDITHYGTATLPTYKPSATSTNTFGSGTTHTPATSAALISLLAGGTLVAGDTVVLTDGVDYNASADTIYLPAVTGASFAAPVWLVTSNTSRLTSPGVRIGVANRLSTPHFQQKSNNNPALWIKHFAHGWRLVGICVDVAAGVTTSYGVVKSGLPRQDEDLTYAGGTTYNLGAVVKSGTYKKWESLQNSNTGNTPSSSPTFWREYVESQLPKGIVFDRCIIESNLASNGTVHLYWNETGEDFVMQNCYLHSEGGQGEPKAFSGDCATGRALIDNNYIAAPGINMMMGGGGPAIHEVVMTDVTIERNHFYKKPSWFVRGGTWDGLTRGQIKNLWETKQGKRWLFQRNFLENASFGDAGQPFCFVIKLDGSVYGEEMMETRDITVRNNHFKKVQGWMAVGVYDVYSGPGAVAPPNNISIYHNFVEDYLGHYEDSSYAAQVSIFDNSATAVHFEHNTAFGRLTDQETNAMQTPSGALPVGWTMRNNNVSFGRYGYYADGFTYVGQQLFDGGCQGNVLLDPTSENDGFNQATTAYNDDTKFKFFTGIASCCVDFAGGSQQTAAALANTGYGGRTPGCDVVAVKALTTGCASGSW